jgi:hypothetical protein
VKNFVITCCLKLLFRIVKLVVFIFQEQTNKQTTKFNRTLSCTRICYLVRATIRMQNTFLQKEAKSVVLLCRRICYPHLPRSGTTGVWGRAPKEQVHIDLINWVVVFFFFQKKKQKALFCFAEECPTRTCLDIRISCEGCY